MATPGKRHELSAKRLETRRQRITADIVKRLSENGAGPEILYAFRKTGTLVRMSQPECYPPAVVTAWHNAIAEYYELAMEAATRPRS